MAPPTDILGYVNTPYNQVADTTTQQTAQSLASYGIYDVLGETTLDQGPNPGVTSKGMPYFDIEDPKWGTEQYPALDAEGKPLTTGQKNWASDSLIMGLPSVTEKPKTCEDACILASKKRISACDALRKRVKDALDKAGCPCDIQGRDKTSTCSASSGFPARSRRSLRSRRSRRSKPRRVVKRSKR